MSDQNSAVDYQIRPDDLMEELGIKKDAYYSYVKFLSIKVEKADGKAFLSTEQANLIRALRSHVVETGEMKGFVIPNSEEVSNLNSSELAVSDAASIESVQPETEEVPIADDFDYLIRAAAELKGQQLVMPQLIMQALADKMTYEDLPEDVRQKVDSVRKATSPKSPSLLADQLLQKHRSRQQVA